MCGYSTFLCNTPSKIELHLGLSLCLSVFWLLVNCSLSKGGSEKMSQQTWADSANVSRQSFNLKFGFWNVSKIFQKFPTQLSNQPFFLAPIFAPAHHNPQNLATPGKRPWIKSTTKGALSTLPWMLLGTKPQTMTDPWGPEFLGKMTDHDYLQWMVGVLIVRNGFQYR